MSHARHGLAGGASERRRFRGVLPLLAAAWLAGGGFGTVARAAEADSPHKLLVVKGVEVQPLVAQARRIVEALDFIGQPLLSDADRQAIAAAADNPDAAEGSMQIQRVLDGHCIAGVNINPESRVKVAPGPAKPLLVEQGWRTFLVKVHNEAGVTAELRADSPNAQPVYVQRGGPDPEVKLSRDNVRDRWMDLHMFNDRPMTRTLSGLMVEYRILQVFSRDSGRREASLGFNVDQGTQDIGFRNDIAILFSAEPSADVKLKVLDEGNQPTMAWFVFRDEKGRVYPSQSKRLAPDFFFHPQIYRGDGETITLPTGTYDVKYGRGPEYLIEKQTITVSAGDRDPVAEFKLNRWIHPAKMGWYSGDHHVHAAGCAHYTDPTRGVTPEDMMRHILGEDLNVGCVLSWGPCWYHQKTFFEGGTHPLSRPGYIMRYDVEVSGFPSDYAGHLCLLGLTEDDYTYPEEVEFDTTYKGDTDLGHFKGRKTSRIAEWPAWDLPILKWGKEQGAVVGFSHSGWGLDTKDKSVLNYEIPPFNGIGANEYIVDVTHDVVDFISAVDTPWPNELNIWYHTNNAGYRCKLSGETDFPCIYGERVGLGRGYVQVDGELTFEKWLAGIKAGRSYVGDGKSHLLDFRVNDREVGEGDGEVKLDQPGPVKVRLTAAAYLPEQPENDLSDRPIEQKPYWDVERARVKGTRRVAVEIVVNGQSVASREMVADGKLNEMSFDVDLDQSSWIAARIHASSHTNPVYVLVGGKPIRASRKSLQWCIDSVERCWQSKSKTDRMRDSERVACRAAYDAAAETYRKRLAECTKD